MEKPFSTRVDIDGVISDVMIAEAPDGTLYAEINGRRMTMSSGRAKSSAKSQRLFLDGEALDFGVVRLGDGYSLVIEGTVYEAHLSDPRAARYASLVKAPKGASRELVKAPMPGLIVSVLVKAGDTVSKGDTLLTLNAMKLENDIRASKGGVVQEVFVAPEDAVEKGSKLVLVE